MRKPGNGVMTMKMLHSGSYLQFKKKWKKRMNHGQFEEGYYLEHFQILEFRGVWSFFRFSLHIRMRLSGYFYFVASFRSSGNSRTIRLGSERHRQHVLYIS